MMMNERELHYSDAMDVLVHLMESAPSTASMLRLSSLIGAVHDAMHAEINEPSVKEIVQ